MAEIELAPLSHRLDEDEVKTLSRLLSEAGAPSLVLHGPYRELFERRRWRALVSLSHSGDFASSVVMVVADAGEGGVAT